MADPTIEQPTPTQQPTPEFGMASFDPDKVQPITPGDNLLETTNPEPPKTPLTTIDSNPNIIKPPTSETTHFIPASETPTATPEPTPSEAPPAMPEAPASASAPTTHEDMSGLLARKTPAPEEPVATVETSAPFTPQAETPNAPTPDQTVATPPPAASTGGGGIGGFFKNLLRRQ